MTVADVNGDRKPDVVAVTEDAVVWYENPSWRKQDIIRRRPRGITSASSRTTSTATAGSISPSGAGWRPPDTKNPSTLQWLGRDAQAAGRSIPIRFEEPDTAPAALGRRERGPARSNWWSPPCRAAAPRARTGGKGRGCASSSTTFPRNPGTSPGRSRSRTSSLHTIHNLQLLDVDGDHRDEIVVAAWEGVFVLDRDLAGRWTKTRLGTGNQESNRPKGRARSKSAGCRRASPTSPRSSPGTVTRSSSTPRTRRPITRRRRRLALVAQVIAEPLQWGHAVWCADLDDDDDDELIIGQRDPNKPGTGPRGPGVFVFDPKPGLESARLRAAHGRRRRHGLRGRPGRRPGRRRPSRHHRRRTGHT